MLDLDPDLGAALDTQEREQARQVCIASLTDAPPGDYALTRDGLGGSGAEAFAAIITDGVLCREAAMGAHRTLELLCVGDVLLLPPEARDGDPLQRTLIHTALSGLTLMVLGAGFLRAAARWPSLSRAVQDRLAAQHARLILQTLTLHLPRAEQRILVGLWTLAQRCGRVTPDGLLLPVRFSHATISRLVAARRPTVSLALRTLRDSGQVLVGEDGFLLTERGRQEAEAIIGAPVGEAIGPQVAVTAFGCRRGTAVGPARDL